MWTTTVLPRLKARGTRGRGRGAHPPPDRHRRIVRGGGPGRGSAAGGRIPWWRRTRDPTPSTCASRLARSPAPEACPAVPRQRCWPSPSSASRSSWALTCSRTTTRRGRTCSVAGWDPAGWPPGNAARAARSPRSWPRRPGSHTARWSGADAPAGSDGRAPRPAASPTRYPGPVGDRALDPRAGGARARVAVDATLRGGDTQVHIAVDVDGATRGRDEDRVPGGRAGTAAGGPRGLRGALGGTGPRGRTATPKTAATTAR